MRRVIIFVATLLPALAQAAPPTRDHVGAALAGHAAEQAQSGAAADPLRRPLFFDPVTIENTPAGVSCAHRAATRPDLVAGQGAVVLLEAEGDTAERVRFWLPPEAAQTEGDPVAAARRFAAETRPSVPFRLIATRVFLWCR